MKLLKLMFSVMKDLSGDEFKVFSVIANTLNMNRCNRMHISRQTIAEVCGWWDDDKPKYSMNKVSKITKSLEEKGLVKKDEIFDDGGKSKIFYTIPTLEVSKSGYKKIKSFDKTLKKSVALNSIYNNHKCYYKDNSIYDTYSNKSTNNSKELTIIEELNNLNF